MVNDEFIGDNNSLTTVFDMVFLIPTYNRYDMLVEIINEIETQCVYKKYKIIIFDDNSTDKHYGDLTKNHKNIKYYKSETNNGKVDFYKNINYLFNEASQVQSKLYTFLADDLQLSKNFVTYIEDLMSVEGVEIINYHINKSELYTNWGYGSWVDGAFVMSNNIPKRLKEFKFTPNNTKHDGSGIWASFTSEISKEKYKVYFTNIPLVKHLGHTNSVMHPEHRKIKPLYTNGFIDDLIEHDLKLLEPLDNVQLPIKKKRPGVISNGNTPEKKVEPIQASTPTTNSPIEFDKSKLDKIKQGLEAQKQSRITKINDDVFVAKARKRNLKLGGR